VPCWYVPNGVNVTIACANGYWQTTDRNGIVTNGTGIQDPSETYPGSTIDINQGGAGKVAAPPTGQIPTLGPYQAPMYGYPMPE